MQRIGVFVCHCGTNIAGTVDVKAVAEALKTEPGVVFSTDYQYMCSQAGQEIIKNAIAEYKLTGIVVCSCSPRMHEATFRKTAAAAGLNPYMVEIANIREQCSWVHKEMPIGTEKAIILAKAAVAKVNLNAPLTPGESPVTKVTLRLPLSAARVTLKRIYARAAGFAPKNVRKRRFPTSSTSVWITAALFTFRSRRQCRRLQRSTRITA